MAVTPATPMTVPSKGQYQTGPDPRFRFFYPRPDSNLFLKGQWCAFDDALLSCAPPGRTFVMHHESDAETRRSIAAHMRADLRISDGAASGLFRRAAHYIVEQDVPLSDVTAGRFDWGIWWDVVVCADPDSLLRAMTARKGNPQALLHDGPLIGGDPKFVLFRNFYVDEVSVRCRDEDTANAIFRLASHHRVPMLERSGIDFYEGAFDLPEGGLRIDQSKPSRSE